MKPLISVIIPIYKVPEKYLRKCIESVIIQSLKNIEIILVDDESPDDCGKICDEYAKKDDRIIVIHQKNKGLCGARNSGVNIANGTWITFVDGDDWIEKNMCETLYNAISNDIDIICCGVIKDYSYKIKEYNYDNLYEDGKVYSTEEELRYMRMMLLNFNGNNAWAVAKLVNRKFIIENGIYHNEKLSQGAEALEFNIRLFEKAKKIKFIRNALYHYIYNDNSITTTHNEKNHYMVLSCFEEIKKHIDNNDKDIMFWFYNRLCYAILTTAISGYFNPSNKENYFIKKKKYGIYLNHTLVRETIESADISNLDKARKVTFIAIKHKFFFIVNIVSKIRSKQRKIL